MSEETKMPDYRTPSLPDVIQWMRAKAQNFNNMAQVLEDRSIRELDKPKQPSESPPAATTPLTGENIEQLAAALEKIINSVPVIVRSSHSKVTLTGVAVSGDHIVLF